jgi:hypothetical protein
VVSLNDFHLAGAKEERYLSEWGQGKEDKDNKFIMFSKEICSASFKVSLDWLELITW